MKRFSSHCTYRSGFTLAEMSIVIIIIGLLMGVTLVGQDLIRSAELRSITKQAATYRVAIRTFIEKYNAMPGDLKNATSYWGADTGCPSPPIRTTPTQLTCDGNGDGMVNSLEIYLVPQHLSNAGFIEGGYTGRVDTTIDYVTALAHYTPGINMPRIARDGILFAQHNGDTPIANDTADTYGYMGNYGGRIDLAKPLLQPGFVVPLEPLFTTKEAFDIDSKLDDGKPGAGNIVTYKPGAPGVSPCATTTLSTTAAYNFAMGGIQCMLIMRNQY